MSGRLIISRDCSLFPPLNRDDEDWLKRLIQATDVSSSLLPVGSRKPDDDPIAVYEGSIGRWRAGRYVGELQFENGTLRIEPRFGMPSLLRWLGEIWGVKLLDGGGAPKEQGLWLWVIIAHLWSAKLSAAAKHGLPYRRIDAIHKGPALRGKLLPVQTALVRAVRDDCLVSKTRIRVVDRLIGDITLLAAQHLNRALGMKGQRASWLPERGREILDELKSSLGTHRDEKAVPQAHTIRYTPITEGYRPLVQLSVSIITHNPHAPGSNASAKSHGVLLDMAEIWELYIAKILHTGLPNLHVLHTGRTKSNFQWLLTNEHGGVLQSLRPDIVVFDNYDRCLAIVDAKYKNTRSNSNNVNGVLREDLYQLSAYLSAFGNIDHRLEGVLIYPEDGVGQVTSVLSSDNPWRLTSSHNRYLSFMSVDGNDVALGSVLSKSEQVMIEQIYARLDFARQ
ncbi:5-methylcytosine restriction system specificity protein McrC [Methylorubrum thiocyanatum]|uniref:5-methylcytosine restriction system specificity protein McrC n=1 Tax=Methylorubrum thiocyanatum TaxID=47958 RepID=UPI0035C82D68